MLRGDGLAAGVEHGEAAGAVGRLDHARARSTPGRSVAACWSPAMPRIGMGAPNSSGSVAPNSAALSRTSGSMARGTPKMPQQLVVPGAGVDVEQAGARGVGRVGRVHAPARQPPQQEAVDGAEGELAALGPRARAGHVIEDPGDLGGREIRVEPQAGLCGDDAPRARPRAAPRTHPPCAGPARRWRCGSARPVARSQTTVVSRWLEMPMATMFAAAAGLRQRLARGRQHRAPDLLGVVLDPARARESAA